MSLGNNPAARSPRRYEQYFESAIAESEGQCSGMLDLAHTISGPIGQVTP